jgi:Fe2+ or Zn2+ uptake regulation protein
MNAYADAKAADRRLAMLQALMEDPACRMNDRELQSVLQMFAHDVSAGSVRKDLAWLAAHGLVSIEQVVTLQVVTLTELGRSTARGHNKVDGVAQPRLEM